MVLVTILMGAATRMDALRIGGIRNIGPIQVGMIPKTPTLTHYHLVGQLSEIGGGMEIEKHLGNPKATGVMGNSCHWTLPIMYKNAWARKWSSSDLRWSRTRLISRINLTL